MMNLTDKIILFCSCLAVYLLEPSFGMKVPVVLIAVIISALVSYYEHDRACLLLAAVYIVWCLFLPGLLLFLPLICYDLFNRPFQMAAAAALIPVLWHVKQPEPIMLVPLLLLVFALTLKRRTAAQMKLQEDYKLLRDTSREMSLTLKRQNQELLDRQDDRIGLATLNERNRIAREIHDNVGHLLSSALLQMGALLAVTKDEARREPLVALKSTLSSGMDSIRQSVHNLYDESVDLHAKLRELTGEFSFCFLQFDYDIQSNPDKRLKYAFISIVKEALSNIARHSDATFAKVTLREHPAFYQLIIADNGAVKDVNPDNGIGLKNIESRVEAFHGNMHISAKDGFALFISVPKEGNLDEGCGGG